MRIGTREIIFAVVLLAVPAAAYLFVFKPHYADVAAATQEIESKQQDLDKLEAVDRQIDDIREAILVGQENIEMIEQKLPSEKGVHDILQQITDLAFKNHLIVKRFETSDDVETATYREKPIRMVIDGSFDGFYSFMIDLENLPRITRVHQLTLERFDQKKGPEYQSAEEGWMQAELQLRIFFQPRSAGAVARR